MLPIPDECKVVWGMFAAAVVEKPAEFMQAFEILLRHSSEAMLRLLASAAPDDLAYTMLCYLPEDTREQVARYIADNEQLRQQVLTNVRECQATLKAAIQDRIAQGDKAALTLLKSA